jgi:choline dehydrogenase
MARSMVTACATREVILCAGSHRLTAIAATLGHRSPAHCCSAMVSGDVVHDLPGVGANLQDHLQIRTVFKVQGRQDAQHPSASSLWGKARMGLEYALKRSGPMSMATSQLGAFTRSDPAQPTPISGTTCSR